MVHKYHKLMISEVLEWSRGKSLELEIRLTSVSGLSDLGHIF